MPFDPLPTGNLKADINFQELARASPGGLVGDHGALLGLPDDDHAQYLLLAGRGGQVVNDDVTIDKLVRKLPEIDCTHPDFGTIVSGNLTANLQAAIDYAAGLPQGGRVLVPPVPTGLTTWLCSGTVLKEKVVVSGVGRASKITTTDSAVNPLFRLENISTELVGLENLWLDGARATIAAPQNVVHINNAAGTFVEGDVAHWLSRLYIGNASADAIYLSVDARASMIRGVRIAFPDAWGINCEATDCIITDCQVVQAQDATKGAYRFANPNNRVVNAKAGSPAGTGFLVTGNAWGTELVGVEVQGGTTGFDLSATLGRCLVRGTVQLATTYGFRVNSPNNNVSGVAITCATAVRLESGAAGNEVHVVSTGSTVAQLSDVSGVASFNSLSLQGESTYIEVKNERQTDLRRRLSTQFDKTDTTLAAVGQLSVDVEAGKIYAFRAVLHFNADVVGGHKYSLGGSATATAIVNQVTSISNPANTLVITSRLTALGGAGVGQSGATSGVTTFEGLITVNAGGIIRPTFAQNAAAGTSSILVGSYFELVPIGV